MPLPSLLSKSVVLLFGSLFINNSTQSFFWRSRYTPGSPSAFEIHFPVAFSWEKMDKWNCIYLLQTSESGNFLQNECSCRSG